MLRQVKSALFRQGSLYQKRPSVNYDYTIKFGEGKRRNEFAEWHVAWLAE